MLTGACREYRTDAQYDKMQRDWGEHEIHLLIVFTSRFDFCTSFIVECLLVCSNGFIQIIITVHMC